MTGHVLNVIPGQREALRVSPAEIRLTVYRRRLVSESDVTFRFLFGFFSEVANDS